MRVSVHPQGGWQGAESCFGIEWPDSLNTLVEGGVAAREQRFQQCALYARRARSVLPTPKGKILG
jgi:hypothetical protein